MKRALSFILSVLMIVSLAVPYSLLVHSTPVQSGEASSDELFEKAVVSVGKPVTIGAKKTSVPKVTDGITNTNNNYTDSTNYGTVAPRSQAAVSTCYVEIDLGKEYPVSAINTVTYVKGSRVYKWDAYLSTDNSRPIDEWTLAGGKTTDEVSTYDGYTLTFNPVNARYVRVYGTANSDNTSFHWLEVLVYAELCSVSAGKTAAAGSGADAAVVTDKEKTNDGCIDIPWGSSSGNASSAYGVSGNCYVEIDLEEVRLLSEINVVNYLNTGRYYQWEAYGSCDRNAPVSSWRKLCENKSKCVSTAHGVTVSFEPAPVRYLRIYGTYNSANTGYHFVEVTAYSGNKVKANAAGGKTAFLSDGSMSGSLTDSALDVPVSFGAWGSDPGDEASSFGISGGCYAEIDLGSATDIFAIFVQNPDKNYKWAAYSAPDRTLPIAQWNKLGGKEELAANAAHEIGFDVHSARYVRIYGLYNARGGQFHANEIAVYAASKQKTSVFGIEPVGDGFVNLKSKDATNGFALQTVVKILDGDVSAEELKEKLTNGSYSAHLVFTDPYGSPYEISADPHRYDGDDVWYFEPVLKGFVPVKGQYYTLRIDIYNRQGDLCYTASGEPFVCLFNPVYVYDEGLPGAYTAPVSILSYPSGTPAVLSNGAPVLRVSGLHDRYFAESDPEADGFDLSRSVRFFVDGVEYLDPHFVPVGGKSYSDRTAEADMRTLGFAPSAGISHHIEISVYSPSYPSGATVTEERGFLPAASFSSEVTGEIGYSYEIYESEGDVTVSFINGSYLLTATGAHKPGYTFKGWYSDGLLISTEQTYTFPAASGENRLIVGMYVPSSGEQTGVQDPPDDHGAEISNGALPGLTYSFNNDLKGSAAGTVTFEATASGTYSFFWLDAMDRKLSASMNGKIIPYSSIRTAQVSAGGSLSFDLQPYTAIPYGAKKIAVYKGSAMTVSLALPEEKLLAEEYRYAYGLMSDLHYNTFPKYVEGGGETDYAIDSVNNAYRFFREAGVTTVFQTGDYSCYQDEVAYQRYAEGVAASGLTVLAAGGNHEVNGTFEKMFGENGLWFRYVNLGVYNGQNENVIEIAPDGFNFVYRYPAADDVFVFVSQEKWDGRKETQGYLISPGAVSWLEGVLERYRDKTVHLMLHTFFADDDGENVDGEGDFTNSVGYGYHYNYNVHTEDYRALRALLAKYRNVIWFNGHSHWTYAMQQLNVNLNVFDYNGTFATCVHVPSVTAPRTVGDTGTAYSSNAGSKSEGTLAFRGDGYEIIAGVDFMSGELLSYGCYIVYDQSDGSARVEGELGNGTNYVFDRQTSVLSITGNGDMPDFTAPENAPYAAFADEVKKVYISNGVTSVGRNAFGGFSSLETAELKGSVLTVGENAFGGDHALASLSFTDSVKRVGSNAFSGVGPSLAVRYDGALERFEEIEISGGNDALQTATKTFTKYVITFVFGDIRDTRDVRAGEIPVYDGTVFKAHDDPGKSYLFAGWTDGLICYSDDLPEVSSNAVYYALFNEMEGGTAEGDDRYIHWFLDKASGLLTITGYGPMTDYAEGAAPWYPYRDYIRNIVVKKGVLSLSENAFRDLTAVVTVTLETKLISIGGCAMMGMTSLKSLYLPSTFAFGAKRMTYQSSSLEHIYFDGSAEEYAETGSVVRLWGNNEDFAPDGGKMIYHTGVTHEETFTAIFRNDDGTVLAVYDNVAWGTGVTPPEMHDRENEYFLGWNGNYRYVTDDLVLTAVFSTEKDPDLDVEIEPKSLAVKPYYGKIENYGGATYFITGITADSNETLFSRLKSGAMKLRATLKDENTKRSYIVEEYHFDTPSYEFYGTSFLRLNFCSYGVVPDPAHAYTVALDVYSGKNTIYSGISEEGAFLTTNEAFAENGAIVPSAPPYTCTVICTTHERASGDCTTEGECRYCGQTLPAGEHTVVTDPRVAPTATKTGLTEGAHCAVCGKIIIPQEIIPATGVEGVNVALYKKVLGVGAGKTSITDGDTSISNFWDGGVYPSGAIIDLDGYYDLSDINVVTYHGDGRYYCFTVETSTDGRNWTQVGAKTDNEAADENGTDIPVQITARYVKITITKNSANTSAHLVEVSVYGVVCPDFTPAEAVTVDAADPGNVAFAKPTRSNSYGSISDYVNDGSDATVWGAYYFPSYVDIDLLSEYDLTSVKISMPGDGYTYAYTVYASTDGINFTRIAKTDGLVASPAGGRSFIFEDPVVCRILRVNVTACGGGTYKTAKIAEIRAYGTLRTELPEAVRSKMTFKTYDEWIEEYAGVDLSAIRRPDGGYDLKDTFTEEDTVNEIRGIVARLLGAEYDSWFTFDVCDNPNGNGKDFFMIEDSDGKVKISGSDGTCIAAGLNWYLKYFCSVHISQETAQVRMPSVCPTVGEPVMKETAQKIRYAYNYCTLSYTMAFYGYEDWRRELDWLYLNGVNLILDLSGVEALWVSYLQKLGYSADEAKNYACGPGYKAWWLMGNLENFNGTVSDTYVADMLEMARRNQRSMTVMGASPALQAFVGTMPDSFGFEANEALTALGYDPVAPALTAQGLWQGFDRPNVLRTDYNGYSYLAQLFYETEEELFGAVTDYFCGDVCHEGGKIPAGLTKADMSAVILGELMKYRETGVWMLQRWQSNPTRAELDGMSAYRTTNVIVIDLASARDTSKWKNTSTYGGKEFGSTNWIFSSLDNFGGRPLMHGALQAVVNNIADAKKNASYMVGMGMTPEGTENNPVYYDLYWEMVWRDEAPDVREWIEAYAARRYGAVSESILAGWEKLLLSVYAYPNTNGTSGNFMVIGNKPRFDSYVGGYYEVQYSNRTLLEALGELLTDFDTLADNECYIYDLVEIMQTYLANKAQNYISTMIAMSGNPNCYSYDEFEMLCERFLDVIALENEISSYSENQLLGKWLARSADFMSDERTGDYDDYMADTFTTNGKMLISSWTSSGVLIDYANRLYNGLTEDYYLKSWSAFLENMKTRFLAGQSSSTQVYPSANYLLDALNFVLSEKEYTSTVSDPRGVGGGRGIVAIYGDVVTGHAPESFEPTVNENDEYAAFGGISKMFTAVEFYSATNAFETWPFADNGTWCARASFHVLIRVSDSGLNYLATGLGTENYPYTWKFYYQEANAANGTEWTGPYTGFVETKSNASFLRHQVADCPEGDLCADFVVGKNYNLLFDVYKGSEHVGFGVLPFTWTAKYDASHNLYTDFWLHHDREEGYRSGDQTVTQRDSSAASGLGFNASGSYAGTAHTHSFGEWTETGAGGDTGITVFQRVCSSCGYTEQKTERQEHVHTPVIDESYPATCTEEGRTEGAHCSECGEIIKAQETIPPLGHLWDGGVITVSPTLQSEGVMTYTCQRCGSVHCEPIPAIERTHGDVDGDGELSINDVTALLDLLASSRPDAPVVPYTDIDGDGELSINDVTALLDILSGAA
ncbi:MAG: alpha-N-acetylglucosaminidase C-terminal domain-containing protein [Clostridia bacterium]|nr:alpha-N-acetylglucosaminidase C-terminal domain-containing protein [Clostridia bacterium]